MSEQQPAPGVDVELAGLALPPPVGYDEFAVEFRRRAVTVGRVSGALASLASRELRFGPYSAGPLVSVEASGTLGAPQVRAADPDAPSFAVTVPATLDLTVRLGALSRVAIDVAVDLLLTPRSADELFLFIDAAPVHACDVRIALRGKGLGVAVSGVVGGLPTALTDEVRRQVAQQISNALRGASLRRARTIDIAARIDGQPPRQAPDDLAWVDDEEFGRQFVRRAVSVARVADGVGTLAGETLTVGPLRAGPGGIAGVRASGAIADPTVVAVDSGFAITLPLQLELVITLAREHRFRAAVTAQLRATPRPAVQLCIVIDVAPVTVADVAVALDAADGVAALLGRAGKVDEQLAAQVCRTINEQIARSPHRVVDVAAIVGGSDGDGDGSGSGSGSGEGDGKPSPRPSPGPR